MLNVLRPIMLSSVKWPCRRKAEMFCPAFRRQLEMR